MDAVLIILYALFAVGGSSLIKYGGLAKMSALFTIPVVNVSVSTVSILGILCYGLSFILYIFLLNRLPLSLVSPVTIGLVYVLLMITAVFIFGEQMTAVKIVGCGLILIGILIVLTVK